jgi:hypothetical protein
VVVEAVLPMTMLVLVVAELDLLHIKAFLQFNQMADTQSVSVQQDLQVSALHLSLVKLLVELVEIHSSHDNQMV